MLTANHNPDVLSCLANLSNDEVFTPPAIANAMLDLLPPELFKSSTTTFLDPACKSGVFLREIAKRLIAGLADEIPDIEKRLDHIFTKQLFGIAITELTAHLSRRSVYCSKAANGKYSVAKMETAEGNIRFSPIKHTWANGRCVHCGAAQSEYDRADALESHAYQFIHNDTKNLKEILKMKFDVIVSNPPYQLSVNESGKGLGAIPLYNKFIEQAIKLSPRFLTMIIPSRWFSGGVGLDNFRKQMLSDNRLHYICDYIDSNDCFPGVDINGGICYFLWEREYSGLCDYTNVCNSQISVAKRKLDEYPIFIRRNEAVSIINKILMQSKKMLSSIGGCSPQTPYGFLSTYKGASKRMNINDCELLSSKGWSYVTRKEVLKFSETIDMYKAMFSKLSCEHAGNPDKNGMYRVLSRMELLKPGQICSQSYLIACPSFKRSEALHTFDYLKTKFVRFLILQTLVGMNISINNFIFVPWVDFSKPWTDEELYAKYGLTQEEIDFIESMIRPME